MSELEIITDIVVKNYGYKKGVTLQNIKQKTNRREIVHTRFHIYKICKELTKLSLSRMGSEFGQDHATALHGIRQIDKFISTYKKDLEIYNDLLSECRIILHSDIMTIKRRYEAVVCDYVKLFSKKQDIEFSYWVADKIGQIAVFGDYFFDFNDIVLDINESIPVGLILEWHDKGVEFIDKKINFYSYWMGLRYEHLEN